MRELQAGEAGAADEARVNETKGNAMAAKNVPARAARLGVNEIQEGMTFGRWTVVGEMVKGARYQKYFPCRCVCGRERLVWQNDLRHGGSLGCKSCQVTQRNLRHGCTKRSADGAPVHTPEYRAWSHLIGRCEDPNDIAYADYGGRGITVCSRWREDFRHFLADMGLRPSRIHSIDRKNNDGPYDPANCRWATVLEQANNKRNNRFITAFGSHLTVAEWGRRTGLKPTTICARLDRLGWISERAVSP